LSLLPIERLVPVTSSISVAGGADQLAALDREEQLVSRQRRLLHQRIDRLYLSAPLDDSQTAQLDELEELEKQVSSDRRKLHDRIDQLRAQMGLPPCRMDDD
jgi:predicted  nucleic acid-binding Zn-ribbon protein